MQYESRLRRATYALSLNSDNAENNGSQALSR